jgi:putative ABC transport system permease protein
MTWLGRLLNHRRLERELDAELRDHLQRQVADYVAGGMPEAEARRRARLEFGGVEPTKEYCRDARGTRLVDDFLQDLRYGWRSLGKSKAFALVAIASLALGIGANTAVFTVVDALILRTLPVHEPARLVRLDGSSWTNPIWEEIRARQHQLFAGAAACSDMDFDLASGGEADFAKGFFASGGFFEVVGVPAILGRTLSPADDRRDGGSEGPAAVISHAFWMRRFGGSADVLGRPLALNGVPFTIVGVTPPGFFGPTVGRSFDVAVPLGMVDRVQNNGERGWLLDRSTWWLEIVARLKPGQSVEAASQALQAVQPQIREATLPPKWSTRALEGYLSEDRLTLVPAATGLTDVRGRFERPLWTVMAVVALVLLIACANLASLLLSRANARRQELGARLALGASRRRLMRQLLTESLLLAVPGALAGLLFARWGSRALVDLIVTREGIVNVDVSLHWRVLLFTAAVTLATTLLFGIAPALRAGRLSPRDAIQQQGRGMIGAGPGAVGRPLVVAQVALSLVLLFGAGLFLRSFARITARDLGLRQDPVLLVYLDAQRSAAGPEQRAALFARVREATAALPGVAQAAVSSIAPVSSNAWNERCEMDGAESLAERERIAWFNAVTPGWFGTFGIPLLAGRDVDVRDRSGGPPVAVVNEAFVRRFSPGTSPVGRQVRREGPPGTHLPPVEIVGVVRDAVYRSPRETIGPTVYLPLAQLDLADMRPFAALAVRAQGGSPAQLTRSVAKALQEVDPRLSLTFRPLAEQVRSAVTQERVVALLSTIFGVVAALLAAIGLYGVTSYAVSRRRTEIGVRMALGADASGVVRLVLRGAASLLAAGIAIGTAASLLAAGLVRSLLYGLEPRDPLSLVTAAVALVAVGLLAAALPARRAARIAPAEVLRE